MPSNTLPGFSLFMVSPLPLPLPSAAKELGLKHKKMLDLLSEGDDSISLMSYLKAMFPYEFSNFKERMKVR